LLQVRSIIFNLALYVSAATIGLAATPALFMPRRVGVWVIRNLSRLIIWLLEVIIGTHCEIRGSIPHGAVLIAAKHQSMWDTLIFMTILNDPAIVLKRELLWIPYYGWFSKKAKMISVNRSAGAQAIRHLTTQGKSVIAMHRPIVIFPEGTRATLSNKKINYKPGVAALYRQLNVPCVPVAVNSGLYWPRRRFMRRPGIIILEFLDTIYPGLDRHVFMSELENRTETATAKLLAEGQLDVARYMNKSSRSGGR
jgi:1-acyl-sn-glycerol-3-phosphate acyltransferase